MSPEREVVRGVLTIGTSLVSVGDTCRSGPTC